MGCKRTSKSQREISPNVLLRWFEEPSTRSLQQIKTKRRINISRTNLLVHPNKIDNKTSRLTDFQQKCRLSVGLLFPNWIPQVQLGTLDYRFVQMSQGLAIDIMTFNSYSLQYYSFWKGKIGIARTVPVFLDNANVNRKRYSLTVDSFRKRIFCVTNNK